MAISIKSPRRQDLAACSDASWYEPRCPIDRSISLAPLVFWGYRRYIRRVHGPVPPFGNFLGGAGRASIDAYALTFAPTVVVGASDQRRRLSRFRANLGTYRCRPNSDVAPRRHRAFNNAMGRAYARPRRAVSHLAAPEVAPGCIRATRAAPIVLRDRIASVNHATRVATFKRRKGDSSRSSKSPRTAYTSEATGSSTFDQSARSDEPDEHQGVLPSTEPFMGPIYSLTSELPIGVIG